MRATARTIPLHFPGKPAYNPALFVYFFFLRKHYERYFPDPAGSRPLLPAPSTGQPALGPARSLPMSREEMDQLGWDSCDIILVTGDACRSPELGMAILRRMLEAGGFRVGSSPSLDWNSKDDFMRSSKPNLFFRRDRRQHGLHDQPLHRRP